MAVIKDMLKKLVEKTKKTIDVDETAIKRMIKAQEEAKKIPKAR